VNGLARATTWVGRRGTLAAVDCLVLAGGLLALGTDAWDGILAGAADHTSCARAAVPVHACESSGGLPWLVLGTLFGPALAALGIWLGSIGIACLLRPLGRLDPHGQRLLDDATRHHAAGGLSQEGFLATRDRLHSRAARREVPQVALALSLFGASLALLAFTLAGSLLSLVHDLRGLGAVALPATRTILGVAGACTAAAVAGAFLVLTQASRWRARTRAEASALQQMLTDLESDILDEVRRSALPAGDADAPEL
jgi:hypothetical protein